MIRNFRLSPLLVLVLALLLSFVVVFTNIFTIIKGNEVRRILLAYTDEALNASIQLNQLERYLGYGGFIHHFKNLVLRRDEVYFSMAEEDVLLAFESLASLKELPILTPLNAELRHVEQTLNAYQTKFYALKNKQIDLNKAVTEIDALVRVDDTQALISLQTIIAEIEGLREEKKKLLSSVQSDYVQSVEYLLLSILATCLSFVGLTIVIANSKNLSREFENLFQYSPHGILEIGSDGTVIKGQLQCPNDVSISRRRVDRKINRGSCS